MHTPEIPESPLTQAIIDEAVARAQAAITAYEDAESELEETATSILAAFEDGWEKLYSQSPLSGLLALTAAWKGLLDQLLTPKDRTKAWFAPHAANFHWRHGRALMDPHHYMEAEAEFTLALATYEIADAASDLGPHFLLRLHEWLGFCRVHQGQFAAARADFLAQYALSPRAIDKAHILRVIAASDWQAGERQMAIARLEEALQLLESEPDAPLRAHIAQGLADMRAQL